MPTAAACAAGDSPMAGVGVARAAEVQVTIAGITRKVTMGGFAVAEFPDKTPDQMANLEHGEQLELVWKNARFVGNDPILGVVETSLREDLRSQGHVKSMGVDVATGIGSTGLDFFPAINQNTFNFQIRIPRFGVTLISTDPIINAANINQIPPIGAVYKLERSVRFVREATHSTALSAMLPSAEVTSCNVKLHVNGGLDVKIVSYEETGEKVTFVVEVRNLTSSTSLGATWMIWPPPPAISEQPQGTLSFKGNDPQQFTFSANRDVFYVARWIAFASSWPFEVSASAAIAVPGLN